MADRQTAVDRHAEEVAAATAEHAAEHAADHRASVLAIRTPVVEPIFLSTLQKRLLTVPVPSTFEVESGTCTVDAVSSEQAWVVAGNEVGLSVIRVTALPPFVPDGHPPVVMRVPVEVSWPVLEVVAGDAESK